MTHGFLTALQTDLPTEIPTDLQADLGCMGMDSILELGCGLGLAGLVAAALCGDGRCVLTDGDEAVGA